jgi:hypothetical protein
MAELFFLKTTFFAQNFNRSMRHSMPRLRHFGSLFQLEKTLVEQVAGRVTGLKARVQMDMASLWGIGADRVTSVIVGRARRLKVLLPFQPWPISIRHPRGHRSLRRVPENDRSG